MKELVALVEGVSTGKSAVRSLGVSDLALTNDLGGVDPGLDPHARSDYRRRLTELHAELDEADRFNDLGRVARAREELDFLNAEMASGFGIGGRERQSGTHTERARRMVGKSIGAALDKIRRGSPALGRHFATSITTGHFCAYQPEADDTVSWQLTNY